MTFSVYILKCSDGTYYTGHTDDLDQRMAQHCDGMGARYTAKRRPLQLLWATDCQTREQAWELEKQVHGWSRAKKEALMRGDFAALPGLSRSRSARADPAGASAATLRQAQGDRTGGGRPSATTAPAEPVEAPAPTLRQAQGERKGCGG